MFNCDHLFLLTIYPLTFSLELPVSWTKSQRKNLETWVNDLSSSNLGIIEFKIVKDLEGKD